MTARCTHILLNDLLGLASIVEGGSVTSATDSMLPLAILGGAAGVLWIIALMHTTQPR